MTHSSVDVLDTAQNIFTVAIGACVGHKLHEHTQTVCRGRQWLEFEEDGKVEPLSNV